MKIVDKNISCRDRFRIECQRCKCKKVSLQMKESAWYCYDDGVDDYYLVCNHCGNKMQII